MNDFGIVVICISALCAIALIIYGAMIAVAKKDFPFKCPVCEGRGTVPPNFYNSSFGIVNTEREECRTCEGETIIWESEYE